MPPKADATPKKPKGVPKSKCNI